ncbi:MAG: polymerase sigma-70 factor, subfamily, partial [Pseudonocardiales bacterium]|nr:polymerase sigma-70 factor, subfamily [Pseudonocardiales bacterium]
MSSISRRCPSMPDALAGNRPGEVTHPEGAKILSDNESFSFETLRIGGFCADGGADVGGALARADAAMAEALRRLSPECRQVLLECHCRGSTVAEAAARLGVSAGTVKSRAHDALHAIRLTLEEV